MEEWPGALQHQTLVVTMERCDIITIHRVCCGDAHGLFYKSSLARMLEQCQRGFLAYMSVG